MFNISQGFDLKSPQFNFARDYYKDIATLKAEPVSNFPDHFITNVAGVLYQLDKNIASDATTGQWRKFGTSGTGIDLSSYATKAQATGSLTIATAADKITITPKNVSGTAQTAISVPLATASLAGLLSPSQKTKLDGIESITKTEIDALFT